MNNDNSYAALTKAYALANIQKKEKFVQNIYIDTLIHESLLKEKKRKLMKKIDEAIDQNNREAFLELSNAYSTVAKELNA